MTDLAAAAQFIAGHARLLERRRFAFLEGDGPAERVVAALAAYRNPDGGIGYLEPDIRTPASQPAATLYALEILHETGTDGDGLASGALDWLRTVSNDDGGVPFVLPTAKGWPHAPWFEPQDDPPSALLITAGLAAAAHRLKLRHPWLDPATAFCWDRAGRGLDEEGAYTVRYVVAFLDAVGDRERADPILDALAERMPADGLLPVEDAADGEVLRPLELAPRPDHVARRLFDDAVIERELDILAAGQQDDGGWTFSWLAWNPAAAWEWRGAVTIEALKTLRAYGRI